MNLSRLLVCLNLFLFITSCNQPSANVKVIEPAPKIDTTKSIKIAGMWVTPKSSIKCDTLGKATGDTLDLVICAEYVYSPFGQIKDKTKLSAGLLKNFNVVNRTDTMDGGPVQFQILKHNASKLIFFFDDSDGEKHSNILKGEIYDADVKFVNGIAIGMSITDFYKKLFDYIPSGFVNRYKVVVLESCVQDINHIYTFESDKLISVQFITDTYWKVNY